MGGAGEVRPPNKKPYHDRLHQHRPLSFFSSFLRLGVVRLFVCLPIWLVGCSPLVHLRFRVLGIEAVVRESERGARGGPQKRVKSHRTQTHVKAAQTHTHTHAYICAREKKSQPAEEVEVCTHAP